MHGKEHLIVCSLLHGYLKKDCLISKVKRSCNVETNVQCVVDSESFTSNKRAMG